MLKRIYLTLSLCSSKTYVCSKKETSWERNTRRFVRTEYLVPQHAKSVVARVLDDITNDIERSYYLPCENAVGSGFRTTKIGIEKVGVDGRKTTEIESMN